MSMNTELVRIWELIIMMYIKEVSQYFLEGLRNSI